MKETSHATIERLLTRPAHLQKQHSRPQSEEGQETAKSKSVGNTFAWLRGVAAADLGADFYPFCGSPHAEPESSPRDAAWFVLCDCCAVRPERSSEAAAIPAQSRVFRPATDGPSPCAIPGGV